MEQIISHDTMGADLVTLAEQAQRWSDAANARLRSWYLNAFAGWLQNSAVQKVAGLPIDLKPTPPPAVHYAFLPGYGEVFSVGPDLVCGEPVPPIWATAVNGVDDVVGGPIPGNDGMRYDVSNTGKNTAPGQIHQSADGKVWVYVALTPFNHSWKEAKVTV